MKAAELSAAIAVSLSAGRTVAEVMREAAVRAIAAYRERNSPKVTVSNDRLQQPLSSDFLESIRPALLDKCDM